jgi:UDP-glucose:glycoprotein glucosyltransferase
VEDGHVTQPEALSTFKLALAMRSAAPRIEAHYQYYTTGVEPKMEPSAQDRCEAWVLFNGARHCSTTLADPLAEPMAHVQTKMLPFDRFIGSGPEAILYADVASPSFRGLHKTLAAMARNGELSYRLRHRRHPGANSEAVPVSGYGVELALKKTDYIVIDDREAEPVAAQKVTVVDQVVLGGEEDVADLKPLSKAELGDLGLKTSSFIMKSDDPFKTLLQLSQDFPKYSTQMVAQNASKDFIDEHETKLEMVPSGFNVLWMNGVQLIERQIEPYTLVDMLRRERKMIDAVKRLGMSGRQAIALLGHSNVTQAKVGDEPLRFDWRDDLEEKKVIMWLNDIEKDDRYEDWPDSIGAVSFRNPRSGMPKTNDDV